MLQAWTSRHRIALYFVLAYAFSWSIGLLIIVQAVPLWCHYATTYGPAVSAVAVMALTQGRAGVGAMLRRALRAPRLPWLILAISPFMIWWIVGIGTGTPHNIDALGRINFLPGLGARAWLFWIATSGVGEELGWRGFALPALQTKYSALTSSLIVGSLWALWHIAGSTTALAETSSP
jgi:membrane protease YdiL (CAAX protease family)